MKQFKVIPAIDLMEGQCVRLVRGDFNSKTIYHKHPIDLAKSFLDVGLDYIHVVDLDGARIGYPINLPTVEMLATTGIHIELGGGLRTKAHIQQAFDSGVRDVILGSSLLSDKSVLKDWLKIFPQQLVAGIDVRNGQMAIRGWTVDTTATITDTVNTVANLGFCRIIYTDIVRDGTLSGPNLEQAKIVAKASPLPMILSGGISSKEDILSVKKMESLGVCGVIVGKAFYEGRITLKELSQC